MNPDFLRLLAAAQELKADPSEERIKDFAKLLDGLRNAPMTAEFKQAYGLLVGAWALLLADKHGGFVPLIPSAPVPA